VDKTSTTELLHFYHRNNLYSVTAISNATGAIEELYAYDAYGNRSMWKGFLADFNGDGLVDGSDYGIWNANKYQPNKTHATGDANGDTICDGADFNIWNQEKYTNPAPLSASTVANRFTFTGREYDPETAIYYYRARYYDSRLGRFIGRDPIGFEGSHWNLYEYTAGNSLRYTDPTGTLVKVVGACAVGDLLCPEPTDVAAPIKVPAWCIAIGGALLVDVAVDIFTESEEERRNRCNKELDNDWKRCEKHYKKCPRREMALCFSRAMDRFARCLAGEKPRPRLIPTDPPCDP
jgi:RHS repeat-associated protein